MNKKHFLIKQFPITKISELIGKKTQKQKQRIKKRTQIYNNPSHKSKNSIKKKKKKRTQNLKRESTNGGLRTVGYDQCVTNGGL